MLYAGLPDCELIWTAVCQYKRRIQKVAYASPILYLNCSLFPLPLALGSNCRGGGVEVRVGVLEDTSLGELPRFAEHQLGTACRGMCVQTKTGVHPYLRGTDRKRIPDEIVEQLHPGSAAHNLAYAPVAELPTQAIRGLRQPGIDEVRLA